MLTLTTLEKVKTPLKNPSADLDTLIEDLIKAYSQATEEYCFRKLDNDRETEFFDGGVTTIFLSRKPVTKIVNVWVDDDWVWSDDDLIPADHYHLVNADTGMLTYKYGYWYPAAYPKGVIKVLYEGGYDEAPYDLEMAIRIQVAYKIKRRDDVGLTAVSFPDGLVQKRIVDEFLPEVKEVLDRYKPIYVG